MNGASVEKKLNGSAVLKQDYCTTLSFGLFILLHIENRRMFLDRWNQIYSLFIFSLYL